MSDVLGDFVPSADFVDFVLRANALRDYQRLISEDANQSTLSTGTRYQMWVIREISNIAYCPLDDGLLQKLSSGVSKNPLPNSLASKIELTAVVLANMVNNFDTDLTRKQVLKEIEEKISGTQEDVFEVLGLRSSLATGGESRKDIWSRAISATAGEEPWLIKGFATSTVETVVRRRIAILRGLHEALSTDISVYENPSQVSEFGVRQISLLKIANAVHKINDNVFPAEVGTVLRHVQNAMQIGDKRRFVRLLSADFHLYVGFFHSDLRDLEYEVLAKQYFG